ncbi:histone acetyltransferases subunit 3-domain-containing protein [Vararia minispora EC-137]|uniref:Histone acetyltransferases subunit 3-domain-containing protein n=1 Tax=Vararia minispora EC-137 TaxID=1314806 RepID=A0ACB8QTF9_9AGAM|nr:histone acetyltransferases subunit 3-domain-containing protein [Vararia minispora EC-137]
MAPILAAYVPPTSFRHNVGRAPSEPVPPTDELEALQRQLQDLRQQSLERARKASEDLRTIEDSMRKLKEREKGKAKAAAEKVKRERGFTPLTSDAEPLRSSLPPNNTLPNRPSFAPPTTNNRPTPDPRKSKPMDMKSVTKKKKRKRDDEEEDEDSDSPLKVAKIVPTPAPPRPFVPKAAQPTGTFANLPTKPPSGPDFSLPPSNDWLPVRPQPAPPPRPGPSKATDVMDDFSKAKQPLQIPITTFYTSIEPYLRPIKEEDVGFLEWHGDEVEPYILPKLGKHYTEQWEDEDIALHGHVLPTTAAIRASASYGRVATAPPNPRWDPATLADADLAEEELGHGPLTERLVSALIPVEGVWKGVKAAEEQMEGRHGVGVGNAVARQVIVEDLERRIRDSLRYHDIIDEKPDYSDPVDDPIASALRHAQEELRTVSATNKARKLRLAAIAKDRLGHQEYIDHRDALDRAISAVYQKLQRKDGPKAAKKKSHKKGAAAAAAAEEAHQRELNEKAAAGQWPAALGLGPDEENVLIVSDQLRQLVETRRRWVDAVGRVFEEKEAEQPGRIYGLPERSVYEGIEDEVAAILERAPLPGGKGGKGKGRAEEAMDIG